MKRNLDWPGIGLRVWGRSGRYTEAAGIFLFGKDPRPEELAKDWLCQLPHSGPSIARGVVKDNTLLMAWTCHGDDRAAETREIHDADAEPTRVRLHRDHFGTSFASLLRCCGSALIWTPAKPRGHQTDEVPTGNDIRVERRGRATHLPRNLKKLCCAVDQRVRLTMSMTSWP